MAKKKRRCQDCARYPTDCPMILPEFVDRMYGDAEMCELFKAHGERAEAL